MPKTKKKEAEWEFVEHRLLGDWKGYLRIVHIFRSRKTGEEIPVVE